MDQVVTAPSSPFLTLPAGAAPPSFISYMEVLKNLSEGSQVGGNLLGVCQVIKYILKFLTMEL